MPYYMHKKDRNQANTTLPDEDTFDLDVSTALGGLGLRLEDLQGMTEEEIQALVRNFSGEREDLEAQLVKAEELRGAAGPQGMEAGGAYVAANPLAHLASGVGKFQAGRQEARLPGQISALRGQEQAGRGSVLGGLLRRGGVGRQQPGSVQGRRGGPQQKPFGWIPGARQ